MGDQREYILDLLDDIDDYLADNEIDYLKNTNLRNVILKFRKDIRKWEKLYDALKGIDKRLISDQLRNIIYDKMKVFRYSWESGEYVFTREDTPQYINKVLIIQSALNKLNNIFDGIYDLLNPEF